MTDYPEIRPELRDQLVPFLNDERVVHFDGVPDIEMTESELRACLRYAVYRLLPYLKVPHIPVDQLR